MMKKLLNSILLLEAVLLLASFPQEIFAKSSASKPILLNKRFDSCSSNAAELGLDAKSLNSDVVLTGTILKLSKENSPLDDSSELDLDYRSQDRTVSGLIKVWRVLKGSIEDVTDKTRKYKRFKRSAERRRHSFDLISVRNESSSTMTNKLIVDIAGDSDTGLKTQIVELHGLWNSYFCETFLQEGDTRVFFLKKVPEKRSKETRRRRASNNYKKKNRKNKGTKRNRRNKKKKNKISKSAGSYLKLASIKKHKTSPKTRLQGTIKDSHRPQVFESTLVVSTEPSRITLTNLRSIESTVRV